MKLLTLSHGHPMFSPGGGEHAAYALHQHFDSRLGWSSIFLAAGPNHYAMEDADIIELINKKEYLLKPSNDWLFFESKLDLSLDSQVYRFFKNAQPDVVHIHHFHRVGLDLIHAIRSWLPSSRIIFTLHEFLAICPFQGQLLRLNGEICSGATALTCSECLPLHPPSDFLIRDSLFRSAFSSIDHFIAPSFQLMNRYLDWGIPRSNISVVDNILPCHIEPPAVNSVGLHTVFGFLGNITPSKGLDLVLEAFLLLKERNLAATPGLKIFSSIVGQKGKIRNIHSDYFDRIYELIDALGSNVEVYGGYFQHQVPDLLSSVGWLVMGSRWLENSPVVILEALACKKPILVPSIGGMAEKVREGFDGFHYKVGCANSLANLLEFCCSNDSIQMELVANMRELDRCDTIDSLEKIYFD